MSTHCIHNSNTINTPWASRKPTPLTLVCFWCVNTLGLLTCNLLLYSYFTMITCCLTIFNDLFNPFLYPSHSSAHHMYDLRNQALCWGHNDVFYPFWKFRLLVIQNTAISLAESSWQVGKYVWITPMRFVNKNRYLQNLNVLSKFYLHQKMPRTILLRFEFLNVNIPLNEIMDELVLRATVCKQTPTHGLLPLFLPMPSPHLWRWHSKCTTTCIKLQRYLCL